MILHIAHTSSQGTQIHQSDMMEFCEVLIVHFFFLLESVRKWSKVFESVPFEIRTSLYCQSTWINLDKNSSTVEGIETIRPTPLPPPVNFDKKVRHGIARTLYSVSSR